MIPRHEFSASRAMTSTWWRARASTRSVLRASTPAPPSGRRANPRRQARGQAARAARRAARRRGHRVGRRGARHGLSSRRALTAFGSSTSGDQRRFPRVAAETRALAGPWRDVLDAAGTSARPEFALGGGPPSSRFRVDDVGQGWGRGEGLPAWSDGERASARAAEAFCVESDCTPSWSEAELSVPRQRPRSSGRACDARAPRGAVGSSQRGRTGPFEAGPE